MRDAAFCGRRSGYIVGSAPHTVEVLCVIEAARFLAVIAPRDSQMRADV